MKKSDLLQTTVNHYDIKAVNVVPMIDMMEKTAFARHATWRAPRRSLTKWSATKNVESSLPLPAA